MNNLVNQKWIKYQNRKIDVKTIAGKMKIENNTDTHALLFLPKLFKAEGKDIEVHFTGNVVDGNSATLLFLNRKREILSETTINSKMIVANPEFKYFICVLKVFPKTNVEIDSISINNGETTINSFVDSFVNDTLIITPSYPTEENRYFAGFVHSRAIEYKKQGLNFDVAVVYDYKNYSEYTFENIQASRMTTQNLRHLLQKKSYKNILIHFFDERYFNVLEGLDLEETNIFIWVHGPETLYWDTPLMVGRYFEKYDEITADQRREFEKRDEIIRKYNKKTNVKWIFVSDWIKDESEKLINIKFNNYEIIPNIVDTETFTYKEKTPIEQKNIFMLRRFDNINKYAIDVAIRAILELSRRHDFNKYSFNIYGKGDYYDELTEPIKNFSNVNFYTGFYTHQQISEIHKQNGIALFPTRYDAQGVSMCEAGSSGLVVISSENDAIKEFIPNDYGNIIDQEDYIGVANAIENLANDFETFSTASKHISSFIHEKCSYENTVKKEIEAIMKAERIFSQNEEKPCPQSDDIVLTVAIAAYNVEDYIVKTLKSLIIDNPNAKNLEILVINDGSKDRTVAKVQEFIQEFVDENKPIVRLIDKENGGHGSTINVGMQEAKGKYFRIIDGDDWVNTADFAKLIEILKEDDSDIVITDYSEDRVDIDSKIIRQNNYDFMVQGLQYKFDDIATAPYGFKKWGPILATANIRTDKLRKANFKLSEKTFYVDMEYNCFYLPTIETIKYFDLDIYRYFIGRINQSISQSSFVRNIDQHEKVIFNIINFVANNRELSLEKRKYIDNNIILPMVTSHYYLILNVIRSRDKFLSFDSKLRKTSYGENSTIVSGRVKLLRLTHGFLINLLFILRRK